MLLLDKTLERSFSGNWILRREGTRSGMCACCRLRACALADGESVPVSPAASLVVCKLCVFAGSGHRLFCSESLCFLRALFMSNTVEERRGSMSGL